MLKLAFLLSLLGTGFGIWIRRSIPESIDFILQSTQTKNVNKLQLIRSSLNFIKCNPVQSFGVGALTWLGVCVTFAFFIYAPIHMTTVNHLTHHEAFGINSLSLLLLVALIPIFGMLSERINRLFLLLGASAGFAVIALPYFWYVSNGGYGDVLALQLIASIPSACFFSLAPTFIAETFPTEVRCTAFALIYQTAASFSAGLTPLILLHFSHDKHVSPAWLIIMSAVVGCAYLFYSQRKALSVDRDQEFDVEANEVANI